MTLDTHPPGSDFSLQKLDLLQLTRISNMKWLIVPIKSIDNYFETELGKVLHCIL